MFAKVTTLLDKSLQPIAQKLSSNKVIQSISQGMLGIISLTIGVSVVSILINLPIDPWVRFLENIKILEPANELLLSTTSLLAIYIVIAVSYSYAKNLQEDPKASVILSTAVFIILMPQSITIENVTVNALLSEYLGSNGIFLAILIGIGTAGFYHFLIQKNIKIKMPEQVPPMVVEAMNPIVASMIIFGIAFLFKWGLFLTDFGNIFDLFFEMLTKPALAIFGQSMWTPVIYCVMRALFWFFGVHPSPLNAIFFPISIACTAANVDAFIAGEELPYLAFAIMTSFGLIGGTGSTLAFNINMLKAKSARFKAISKLSLIPGIFNINEPLVFGVPMMFNPLTLIPSVLAPIIGSFVGMAFVALGWINSYNFNPTVSVAWVIPYPVAGFLRGGTMFGLAICLALVIQIGVYYPFFRILDNNALKEEQRELADISEVGNEHRILKEKQAIN